MLDTTQTYYFGVARDIEDLENENRRKPKTCPYAANDIVYYYEPGNRNGKIAEVQGWHYDERGNVKVRVRITATGEEITTGLGSLRC